MTNAEIYKKTIGFSTRRLLWDFLSLLILAGLSVGGFFVAEKVTDEGLIGLGIGFLVGIVILVIILRWVSYTYKAGQIAMMTKAVTEDELPQDVIGEGKQAVKKRFTTIAVFFAATGIIKGIFRQIGNGIAKVGERVGGDSGNAIGSAISAVIQTIVAYLCDCCLGWIFYKKDEKPTRATLQGAALFFRHGKTFAKNMGRVFGIGFISLLLIGGVFFGAAYLIFSSFPVFFKDLAGEFTKILADGDVAEKSRWLVDILTNPTTLIIAAAVLVALFFWSAIHSTFVRPFVLVGVLRNYMKSGMEEAPTESSYAAVAKISPKFAKLQAEA